MYSVIIYLIKGYQRFISPFLGGNCRFYPTCSEYAIGAVKQYGFISAIPKIIYRICKCNPFHEGGYDPVCKELNKDIQNDE